jgi:hypothetical protein
MSWGAYRYTTVRLVSPSKVATPPALWEKSNDGLIVFSRAIFARSETHENAALYDREKNTVAAQLPRAVVVLHGC